MYKIKNISKKKKCYAFIFFFLILLIFGFDAICYVGLPDALKVAKLKTIKRPWASEIRADEEYSKLFPLGSNKIDVLHTLENSKFKVAREESKTSQEQEIYFALANFPAGLMGKLSFLSYEMQILAKFENDILTAFNAYIFIQGY